MARPDAADCRERIFAKPPAQAPICRHRQAPSTGGNTDAHMTEILTPDVSEIGRGIGRRRHCRADAARSGHGPRCGTADAALARIQGARRILLKGGIVLTLDRADRRLRAGGPADRGRQDPRGAARTSRCRATLAVIDAAQPHRHSRLRRYPQPLLPGPAARHPAERHRRSRLQSRHPEQHDAALRAGRCLCRHAVDGARPDRHGHDHHGRPLAGQPHARAHRRPASGRCRKPACARFSAIRAALGPARAVSAGYRAAAADLFQLNGPTADARARRRARSEDLRIRPRGRRARDRASRGSIPSRCWRSAAPACCGRATNTSTARISTTRPGG